MGEEPPKKHGPFRRFLFFLKFLEIRLRFIFILVVTALVVGYWDYVQNYYDRWQREHHSPEQAAQAKAEDSEFEYYCGMHPFVVRTHADKCPICGMDLVKRKKGAPTELPPGVQARVQASPERIAQGGIQTEAVLYHLLVRTIRSYGEMAVDETRTAKITARFPGRIDTLMVNATGAVVKKGEPLAKIYSPRFIAASEEYSRALGTLKKEGPPEEKLRAEQLVEAARKRLLLAGFTTEQLEEVSKSGGKTDTITLFSPLSGTVLKKDVVLGENVEEGTVLFSLADLSALWVQVSIIESDLAAVNIGMPVEIKTVAYPGEIFFGTADLIYPSVSIESRTAKVRVSVNNAQGKLRPGMYVNAALRSPLGTFGETPQTKPAAASPPSAKHAHSQVATPTKDQKDADAFLAALAPGTEYYQCPMDPQAVSDKADDKCPLCGMALERKVKEGGAAAPAALPSLPTQTQKDADTFLASLPPGADYFECPMHPEVASSNAGDKCPLCNMALEKKQKGGAGSSTVTASSAATSLLGAMSAADEGSREEFAEGYACPMHVGEVSDGPGICKICNCGMATKKWRLERVLAVPESAVIDTGERKIIYIESSPGLFDAKQVTLGPRVGRYYQVLDDLTLGQNIVAHGAFLIDAEARLNPGQ